MWALSHPKLKQNQCLVQLFGFILIPEKWEPCVKAWWSHTLCVHPSIDPHPIACISSTTPSHFKLPFSFQIGLENIFPSRNITRGFACCRGGHHHHHVAAQQAANLQHPQSLPKVNENRHLPLNPRRFHPAWIFMAQLILACGESQPW